MKRALLLIPFLMLASCKGDPPAEPTPDPADAEPAGNTADTPFEKLDFTAMPADFTEAVAMMRKSQGWKERDTSLKVDRALLEETYALGSAFLVNWQLPEGNFRYMYDWTEGTWVEDDHQVRQAGSLWGIATCYRYRPTPEAKAALDKGLKFWFDLTEEGPEEGTLFMSYPGDVRLDTGTVALVSLAIIEYLKTEGGEALDPEWKAELEAKLDGYLKFIQFMQLPNGHISKRWEHDRERKHPKYNGYYDGESLLAMSKAARQLGKDWLVPTIETAALAMAKTYTIKSWPKDRDSNKTKGFYQWGSMSYWEYYQAGWKDAELFADVAILLGYWMTHTHRTLTRGRNHAYAMEGLAAAYLCARKQGDERAMEDLLFTLDRSMYKLTQWQVGGPLADKNKWLRDQKQDDPLAIGGVMNAKKPSGRDVAKDVSHQLRIDVTQHQMHAVTMVLEDVYTE